MDTTDCITNHTWEQYAAGTLSPDQLFRVQQHALMCELCTDIKEGIDSMTPPAALSLKVAAINRYADKKVKGKTLTVQWSIYLSAAATLIITAGLGWYLWNTRQDHVALHHDPVEKTVPDPATEIPHQQAEVKEKTIVIQDRKKPSQYPVFKSTEKQELTEEAVSLSPASDDFPKDEKIPEMMMDKTEPDKEDIPATIYRDSLMGQKSESVELATKSISSPKHKYKRETLPAAYNNNLSNNNLTLSNSVSDSLFSGNVKQLDLNIDYIKYDKALQHFKALNYDSCRTNLSTIINNPASSYYEDGLMLLAQTQVKQKQESEAKETLKLVIALKGKRNKEADELLKKLK